MRTRNDSCSPVLAATRSLLLAMAALSLPPACGHSDRNAAANGDASSSAASGDGSNSGGAETGGSATIGSTTNEAAVTSSDGNATGSGGSKATASSGGDAGTAGSGGVVATTSGATTSGGATAGSGGTGTAGPPGKIQYVFVIPLENHDQSQIVGNSVDAPYLNDTLIKNYASGSNFTDQLPLSIPSEPHYVWMEAGTNEFLDHTFTNDDAPSASNSTADTDHLVTQIASAETGLSWLSYQEGLNDATGACPIAASGFYAPKHDPFIFFRDVAGDPPSKTNDDCASHHRPLDALANDLEATNVAAYNFVVPDQCHDMHGQSGCPDSNAIRAGDAWLEANLPALIRFVTDNSGVIFIIWDEGEETTTMPFVAVGPGVKSNYVSTVNFTHSSLLKSVELILGLPVLDRVGDANDFSDLFAAGSFP